MAVVDLVVTDLDGTLWFGEYEQTHPDHVATWHELELRGIPVLVATGRRVTSTRNPLARLGLAPPAVMMNGALAIDLATGERFHFHQYAVEDATSILAAFRSVDLEPCVYVDHPGVDVFIGERASTHPDHLADLGSKAERADLDEVVRSTPVLMFGIMGHVPEPFREVEHVLAGVAETHLAGSVQYGGSSFTVTPIGLSKWTGVLAFCARAGIDPARVLAIGDGPNDVELLDAAAVSVAPVDGHHTAVSRADHVVASPRDGGWAEILDFV
jgi:hydroxymethylpyrimidine pyrophosphatase-like HAD family hydrolase